MKNYLKKFLAICVAAVTLFSVAALSACKIKEGDSTGSGSSGSGTSTGKTEVTVASIILDTSSVKLVFEYGENFSCEGLVVKAKMSDDTEKTVAISECEISSPDMKEAGEKTVTVTYSQKTADYTITVKAENKMLVTFNTMGGAKVSPVETNGKTIELPTVTKKSFAFDGWFYDRTYKNAFDAEALKTSPLTKDTVLYAKWKQIEKVSYSFEAEYAEFSGKEKFEYPENAWAKVTSGIKYVVCGDMNNGDTITLKVKSEKAAQATLGIVNNKPDDFTFENVFTLKVNGTAITVGAVKGNGWGGNTYTNFGGVAEVPIELLKGENEITLTIVDKNAKESNLDRFIVTTTDSVVTLVDGIVCDFEAESAVLPEGAMIEEPTISDGKFKPASDGKSVGNLTTAGSKVVFNLVADDDGKAVIGIDMNRADPFTFENLFILKVNGKKVTVGEVKPGYWTGATPYYCFGHLIKAEIELVKGENVIELVVGEGDKNGGKTNLDKITIFSDLFVEWAKTEETAV